MRFSIRLARCSSNSAQRYRVTVLSSLPCGPLLLSIRSAQPVDDVQPWEYTSSVLYTQPKRRSAFSKPPIWSRRDEVVFDPIDDV